MKLNELIEQLELLKKDHPEAEAYEVETNDGFPIGLVDIICEEETLHDITETRFFVRLEGYRPWALPTRGEK